MNCKSIEKMSFYQKLIRLSFQRSASQLLPIDDMLELSVG
jgi:hypothetical protein